jgi:benzoyl-CoA reductase/2-hydroxyglutaryl-CoA dehydratase subunit BcrC/BadD/HgdB
MSSIKILKKLLDDYYSVNNSPVAWTSAFTPSELLTSMDVRCFYPENFAAALSGGNKNTEFIDCSKSEGYSENVCSYALLFAGGFDKGSKYKRVPKPDMLVAANNQCGTLLYWWGIFQEKYSLPLHFINYPKHEGKFLPNEKEYVINQYSALTKAIAAGFGNKFNEKRLSLSIENSIRTSELCKEIQLLRKTSYIPPRIFTDTLLPIVIMKSHKMTTDYYEELLSELKSEFSGRTVEKRLLWLGYPFWFLKERYPYFHDAAGIVMDIYTTQWILDYSGQSLMDKLVNAYGKIFINMPIDWKIKYVKNIISEYKIDGVIIHLNKSCKRDSIGLVIINQYFKKHLNIPALVIESDMANPDWYNSENIRFNIDAFLELL